MSLRFDAEADAITRTTNLPSISSFTVMGWFYHVGAGVGTFDTVFGFGDASNQYTMLNTYNSVLRFALSNFTGDGTGNTLVTGTWYHLAMVANGVGTGLLRGYRAGVLEITTDTLAAHTAATMRMTAGPSQTPDWANIRMAGIKIYGAALTPAEIVTESGSWAPVRTANLNGWYPMTEATPALCVTAKAPGPTGTANDWTIVGGATLTIEADPPLATVSVLTPTVTELLGVGDVRTVPA